MASLEEHSTLTQSTLDDHNDAVTTTVDGDVGVDAKKEDVEDDVISNHSDIGLTESESDIESKMEQLQEAIEPNDPACVIDESFKCPYGDASKCECFSHCFYMPCAEGSSRYAYKGHYCNRAVKQYNKKYGQRCIVKKWKSSHVYDKSFWEGDLRASQIAQKLITKWNIVSKLSKKYRVLTPIVKKNSNPEGVKSKFKMQATQDEFIVVEDLLKGKFEKWNSNSGWFANENASIQAFCHWTYHYTDGKILFCDAQGIRTKKEYVITDPCILSWKGRRYGPADCGKDYIISWFENHKCNQFCQKKWITPIGQTKDSDVIVTESSTFVWNTNVRRH